MLVAFDCAGLPSILEHTPDGYIACLLDQQIQAFDAGEDDPRVGVWIWEGYPEPSFDGEDEVESAGFAGDLRQLSFPEANRLARGERVLVACREGSGLHVLPQQKERTTMDTTIPIRGLTQPLRCYTLEQVRSFIRSHHEAYRARVFLEMFEGAIALGGMPKQGVEFVPWKLRSVPT